MPREEALERLQDVAALWSVGACRGSEVVTAACDALVEGADSPGLRELAAVLYVDADREVEAFLPTALDELGVPFYDRWSDNGEVAAAIALAKRCLAGEITPRELARWAHATVGHSGVRRRPGPRHVRRRVRPR